MINPTTLSEQLLFSTIRIVVIKSDQLVSIGTGFFFLLDVDEKKQKSFIITNKHVVKDGITGIFTLHEAKISGDQVNPSGQFFTVQIDDLQHYCIPHPDNEIDLCAISIEPLKLEADKLGKNVFSIPLDPSMIINDEQLKELSAVEDILMAGYPIGLWDEYNNLPIIRRGITASHPALNFNGKSMFVIDAAIFRGSSGSPIIIANEGIYQSRGAVVIADRIILLGVLFAMPVTTIEGEIVIKEIPTVRKPISESSVPIHLGYIIKAKEILKIINRGRNS